MRSRGDLAFDKTAGHGKQQVVRIRTSRRESSRALSNKTDPGDGERKELSIRWFYSRFLPGHGLSLQSYGGFPPRKLLELSQKFDGPGSSGADTTEADGKGKVRLQHASCQDRSDRCLRVCGAPVIGRRRTRVDRLSLRNRFGPSGSEMPRF